MQRANTASRDIAASSASLTNVMNLNDRAERRRRRGLSDSTLESWGHPSPYQSPHRRSAHFSSIHSLASSVSPISTPRSTWAPGRQPSDPSIRMTANLMSPMSDLPHPSRSPGEITIDHTTQSRVSSTMTRTSPVDDGPSSTLTGANLQNRLNHPVPPRPSQLSQETSPTYIPTALQVGKRAPSSTLPPDSSSEPFNLAPPTADQMATLNKRVSQIRRRPVPISTSVHRADAVAEHDFARVPPSPPRAAWGAAGVPGSPSFNKAGRSPQPLSRNDSRGSQRSASTPNLLISRPRYERLNTIESIQSVHLQERSRSHSQGMMDRPTLMESVVPVVQRRAVTEPKLAKTRKQRRAEKDFLDGSHDGKKRRPNRCVVM